MARSHSSMVPMYLSGRVDSSASKSVNPKRRKIFRTKCEQAGQLVFELFLGTEYVGVVLGHAPHPQQPVQYPRALETVNGPELEQPQRQFPVRTLAALVNEDVHRAVHRLGVIGRALELHRRVHPLGVPSADGPKSRTGSTWPGGA